MLEFRPFEHNGEGPILFSGPGERSVLFVSSGYGTFSAGVQKISFAACDVLMLDRSSSIYVRTADVRGWLLCFDQELFEHFLRTLPAFRALLKLSGAVPLGRVAEEGLLRALLVLCSGGPRTREWYLCTFNTIMLTFLDDSCTGLRQGRNGQLVRAFEQMVDRHFRRQRSTAFYAAGLSVSPRRLNSLCRKWYGGKCVFEVVMERVCSEAERLLSDQRTAIKVVAYELGFCSPQHFRYYFKKFTGASPSGYRYSR